jgi:hypothetical protein
VTDAACDVLVAIPARDEADGTAQEAYTGLLKAGMSAGGHRHVYAANLAVRYPALAPAGGFPPRPHGEEHGLVEAVRRQGGTVLTSFASMVATSARMPGRAEHGLGGLLRGLADHRTGSGEVPIDPMPIDPMPIDPMPIEGAA